MLISHKKIMKQTLITIGTRDRPSELALCLLSLYNQTYQDFDIFIVEDMSGTPLQNYHFLNCVLNLLKMQGHEIDIMRTPFEYGVSRMRQECADYGLKKGYKYIGRVDDDVICENDFIEKLVEVLKDYDISSGVTPMPFPNFIRDSDKLIIGNRMVISNKKIIMNMDDFGIRYTDDKIIPAHHFRSSALVKREVLEKVKYYPTRLSKHGFREEQLFSLNAIKQGFKIGVHLNAVAWHLVCQTGGERFSNSNELIKFNEEILKEEVAKLPNNFIEKYNEKLGIKLNMPTEEELNHPCNLIL